MGDEGRPLGPLRRHTIANLPTLTSAAAGRTFIVTDAARHGDVGTGSGPIVGILLWDGSAWKWASGLPPFTLNESTAPGVGDDSGDGYEVGSIWVDTTADKAYICLNNSAGAAVWTEITQSGGGGGTPTLIEDADQDTKVQTEESADEDTIRMDVAGSEVATVSGTLLTLLGINLRIDRTGTTNTANIRLINDDGNWLFQVPAGGNFEVRDASGGTTPFSIEGGAPTASLYIDSSGSVGIGTSSPAHEHDVSGDAIADAYLRRNSLLYIRDNGGGQSVGTGYTALDFDTSVHAGADYTFSATSSEITFDEDGLYRVQFQVSVVSSSGNRSVDGRAERHQGLAFIAIGGTDTYTAAPTLDGFFGISFLQDFDAGDKLRFTMRANAAGVVTTIADTQRLIIERVGE